MKHIQPIITQAGLNASVGFDGKAVKIDVAYIGIGDHGYSPKRTHTALSNERLRLPIADALKTSPTQWQVAALFDTGPEFPVREVGAYLSDGTLLALWSHPEDVLYWNTEYNHAIQAFSLGLEALPPDSVNVISTGSLNLFFDSEFAQMAAVQIGNMNRHLTALISQTLHL